jgi:hypothetical protein
VNASFTLQVFHSREKSPLKRKLGGPQSEENCPVFQYVVSYTGLTAKVLDSTRTNIFMGIPFNFFTAF